MFCAFTADPVQAYRGKNVSKIQCIMFCFGCVTYTIIIIVLRFILYNNDVINLAKILSNCIIEIPI